MSRRVSLNARRAMDAPASADPELVLIEFDHPELDAPLRLSTDATERVSDEPLRYGTRSTWRGADPETEPFLATLVSLELPGDEEDVPAAARFIVFFYDETLPILLQSFSTPATAHLAIVRASQPDVIEQEYLDLLTTGFGVGTAVSLQISRRPIEDELAPMHIMGRDRVPGLFR